MKYMLSAFWLKFHSPKSFWQWSSSNNAPLQHRRKLSMWISVGHGFLGEIDMERKRKWAKMYMYNLTNLSQRSQKLASMLVIKLICVSSGQKLYCLSSSIRAHIIQAHAFTTTPSTCYLCTKYESTAAHAKIDKLLPILNSLVKRAKVQMLK